MKFRKRGPKEFWPIEILCPDSVHSMEITSGETKEGVMAKWMSQSMKTKDGDFPLYYERGLREELRKSNEK